MKLKQKVDKKVEEAKQNCQEVEEKDQEKTNQAQETKWYLFCHVNVIDQTVTLVNCIE